MAVKRSNGAYARRSAGRRRRQARRRRAAWPLGLIWCVAIIVAALYWVANAGPALPADKSEGAGGALQFDGSLEDVRVPENVAQHMVEYPGFKVNFNPDMHVPNYVVWELTAEECGGTEKRLSNFFKDADVPGCATPEDYRKSGYTRGHMAPAADMKWSAEAMRASNYLTNICPQAAAMNSGGWSTLEENCRAWARRDSAIIIVAGPVLTDRMPLHIGKSRVVVPERFFKVVLAPYADPPRGIGFLMPNGKVQGGVQSHAVSIDEVEAVTGMDFFSALPDSIEQIVERQNSYPRWQTLR